MDDEPIYDVGTGDDDVEDIYGEIMYRKHSPRRSSLQSLPQVCMPRAHECVHITVVCSAGLSPSEEADLKGILSH